MCACVLHVCLCACVLACRATRTVNDGILRTGSNVVRRLEFHIPYAILHAHIAAPGGAGDEARMSGSRFADEGCVVYTQISIDNCDSWCVCDFSLSFSNFSNK